MRAVASRELKVEIVGDASSLNRALGSASKSSSSLSRGFRTLGKAATIGLGAAFAGVAVTLKVGFDELADGQKVMAQTRAGLKSTGLAANVTARDILNLAQSQSNLTGIDDEAVQAGENMLLTFTKVRNEVGKGNDIFNQATIAVENMATRMNDGAIPSGEQLSTTAIRIGKALNDPIKGMGALSRVGVQFDESQKKTITSLIKAGKTMDAQKLILAELTKEFGGSAKEAGETLPGQLSKLRNAFDQVAASVAQTLLPYLRQFLEWVNSNMPTIQNIIQRTVDIIKSAFQALGQAFDVAKGPLGAFKNYLQDNPEQAKILAGAIYGLAAALTAAAIAQAALNLAVLANPYVAAAAGIAALTGALVALYVTNARVRESFNNFFADVKAVAIPTLNVLRETWKRFGDSFIAIGTVIFKTVTLGFRNMLDAMRGIINVFAGIFTGDWRRVWTGVKQIFDAVIGNLLGLVRSWVNALITVARQAGASLIEGVAKGIVAGWPLLVSQLAKLPGAIANAAKTAVTAAFRVGENIIHGLVSGMISVGETAIKNAAQFLSNLIPGWMKHFLGIGSPSKVMADEVGKPLAEGLVIGFVEGIRDFPNRSSQAMKNALVEARIAFVEASNVLGKSGALAVVEGFRTQEQSLAQQIKSALVQATKDALDAARQAVVDAKSVFAAAFDQLASTALEAFDRISSEFETRTERKIRVEDEQRAAADRKRALDEANAAVAAARAALATPIIQREGESPEEFAQRQAEAIQAETEALNTALQQQADAQFAIQRAKDEKQAAQERKQYEASRERQRVAFDNQLSDLEAQLEKGHITVRQFRQRVLALFEKFDVPFRNAGNILGAALAAGLQDSFANAAKAAGDLIDAIAERLKKARFVVTVTTERGGNAQGRQHGGPVRAGSPYIVGEAGPELFIPSKSGMIAPAMAGGGSAMAEVTTQVYLDGSLLTEVVRREMLRFSKRNGRAAV